MESSLSKAGSKYIGKILAYDDGMPRKEALLLANESPTERNKLRIVAMFIRPLLTKHKGLNCIEDPDTRVSLATEAILHCIKKYKPEAKNSNFLALVWLYLYRIVTKEFRMTKPVSVPLNSKVETIKIYSTPLESKEYLESHITDKVKVNYVFRDKIPTYLPLRQKLMCLMGLQGYTKREINKNIPTLKTDWEELKNELEENNEQ